MQLGVQEYTRRVAVVDSSVLYRGARRYFTITHHILDIEQRNFSRGDNLSPHYDHNVPGSSDVRIPTNRQEL